jgi:uncharacterized hydrophobic protein (TIGR00341 family)
MEVAHPAHDLGTVRAILDDFKVLDSWTGSASDEQRVTTRVLLDAGKVEGVMDAFSSRFENHPGWRVVLVPVDATLPRPPAPVKGGGSETEAKRIGRISREQLFSQMNDSLQLSPTFLWMSALSAAVAAIGLIKGNVAIIIGAMVLAPLLAPNIGLALATTLGDLPLARRALRANAVGVSIAATSAVVTGMILRPSPASSEIAARTIVDYGDVALALIAGVAGTLSMTTALSANLIGVMVAVAMMPPLVVAGLMAGARHWDASLGALLLLAVNVIAVNLAGVATFLAQGVLPSKWWQQKRTRRDAWRALAAWSALLGLLALAIHFADFQPQVAP